MQYLLFVCSRLGKVVLAPLCSSVYREKKSNTFHDAGIPPSHSIFAGLEKAYRGIGKDPKLSGIFQGLQGPVSHTLHSVALKYVFPVSLKITDSQKKWHFMHTQVLWVSSNDFFGIYIGINQVFEFF